MKEKVVGKKKNEKEDLNRMHHRIKSKRNKNRK